MQASVENLRPLLRPFPLSLPRTIQMVKTSGAEEGGAAYTRGTAIVLPKGDWLKAKRNSRN